MLLVLDYNMSTKQVIVIRKDLNMRKGKIASQAAHASMKAIFDISQKVEIDLIGHALFIPYTAQLKDWFEDKFTKICVSVDSEYELLNIYNHAQSKGMLCSLIKDLGLTEFDGVPTYTAVAVGPANNEDVDEITGDLKLL